MEAFNRKRVIQILNSAKNGHISADTFKKLLQVKGITPGVIPLPWPVEPVTEIQIRTTEELVFLDYPEDPADRQIPIPGGLGYVNDIPIVLCKRQLDNRFSSLDPDSHFIFTVPDPINVLDVAKYSGPYQIRRV